MSKTLVEKSERQKRDQLSVTIEERSLADLFAEAKEAWGRIISAKENIESLKEHIYTWKEELKNAEAALAEALGRPDEEGNLL